MRSETSSSPVAFDSTCKCFRYWNFYYCTSTVVQGKHGACCLVGTIRTWLTFSVGKEVDTFLKCSCLSSCVLLHWHCLQPQWSVTNPSNVTYWFSDSQCLYTAVPTASLTLTLYWNPFVEQSSSTCSQSLPWVTLSLFLAGLSCQSPLCAKSTPY